MHAKLLQDMQKAGFASEMRTIRAVREADWQCTGAGSYFDRDEHITRTIDIQAYRVARNLKSTEEFDFEYQLFLEVKKSERPWIVFRQAEQFKGVGDAWNNPYFSHNEACSLSDLNPFLSKYSIRHQLGWLGYGVHESFKEPNDTGRWYSAAVTVCKASFEYVRLEVFDHYKRDKTAPAFLVITHPVVVVDGPLFSAELNDAGEPKLEEIAYAPFEFEFGTGNYASARYRVDLVRLSAVPEYLELVNRRVTAITKHLRKAAGNR